MQSKYSSCIFLWRWKCDFII